MKAIFFKKSHYPKPFKNKLISPLHMVSHLSVVQPDLLYMIVGSQAFRVLKTVLLLFQSVGQYKSEGHLKFRGRGFLLIEVVAYVYRNGRHWWCLSM